MIPWWVSLSDGYLIQNIMFENCNCFALFFNAFCRQQLGLSMKAKLKSMLHKRVCMSNTCHFFTFSYNPVEVMGQYQWVESMLLKIIMLAVAFSTQLYVLLVWEAYWHNSTYANLFYVYNNNVANFFIYTFRLFKRIWRKIWSSKGQGWQGESLDLVFS